MTTLADQNVDAWEQIADDVELFARPDSSNDIVALIAFSPVGSAAESRADSGLVSFTGRMLMRGTRHRSNPELAELVDSLGISLSFSAADDYANHHVVTTADALKESIALLAETLFEPSFEPEEIEKERRTTLAAIKRSDDDLMSLSLKRFYEELYPQHGYGLPGAGLLESIGELRREQIVSCHEEIAAGPFRIVAVGNFDAAELRDLLRKEFVARRPKGDADRLTVSSPIPAAAHSVAIQRDSEQAYLVMGYPAPAPTSADYFAGRVLNCLLGEGMSSRLFQALREEKGLAYATGSSYHGLKLQGQLFGYIGTKPESLATARDGMLAEFERIKNEPVPVEELLRAKNYMIGKFLIDHQKNYSRAFYLGHFDQMGLGWQMDDIYPEMISKVSPEDVQRMANEILTEPVVVELKAGQ